MSLAANIELLHGSHGKLVGEVGLLLRRLGALMAYAGLYGRAFSDWDQNMTPLPHNENDSISVISDPQSAETEASWSDASAHLPCRATR